MKDLSTKSKSQRISGRRSKSNGPRPTSKKDSSALKSKTEKSKPPSTREFLLDTAARALMEHGIHGLRYSQIAKMAEVPQPLMGYHFPTLESLMIELVQRQIIKLREVSTRATENYPQEPKRALEAYIRAPFELAAKDQEFRTIWMAFYHLSTFNNEFSEINRQVRNFGRERIRTLVTMTLAFEHRLPEKIKELEKLTLTVQGIITGLAIMAGTEAGGNFKNNADLAVQGCFEILNSTT